MTSLTPQTPSVGLSEVLAGIHAEVTAMPTLDFHTGQIIAWDGTNQTNQVLVLGRTMFNLPVLTSANMTGFELGSSVGILRVRTQYFILGRIVDQSSGLVNPQFPIVLYPQFVPNITTDTLGYYVISNGKLATWEGRIKVSFPFIEIDGVWGNSTGAGSTTYELKLGGTTYGSWTSTTLDVSRKGPFDVRERVGQDWLKVEVAITASTGSGNKAIQPLGCYFRDA
jgi:hypothetical protein